MPSVSGQEVSLKSFVFAKLPSQTNTTVDNHFPQWNYIPTSGVGSLFFNEFGFEYLTYNQRYSQNNTNRTDSVFLDT